jgi:hypothetical protein
MQIIDPAEAVAARAVKRLWPREVGNGTAHFLLSSDTPAFREKVATLFPEFVHSIEVIAG